MKKAYSLLFILLFCLPAAFAQQSALFMAFGKPLKAQKGVYASGSAYLNNDFQKAEVTTISGSKLKDLAVRYDLLNQHVEYSMDNNTYDITDSVSAFTLLNEVENHTGKFVKIKTADMKTPAFLELVYNDKIALYKLNTIKVESEEDFYTKKVTQKYVPSTVYYTLTNNTYKKIGTTKKDFQTAFKGNLNVKDILNSNDADLSTGVTIIALGKAINKN